MGLYVPRTSRGLESRAVLLSVLAVVDLTIYGIEHWLFACGLPGVCEDNVVTRGMSSATARCGRASEAEFEDHVGVVICRGLSMVCSSIAVVSNSPSYKLRNGGRCFDF